MLRGYFQSPKYHLTPELWTPELLPLWKSSVTVLWKYEKVRHPSDLHETAVSTVEVIGK